MDDFLNNVDTLAAIARKRQAPVVDVQSIMRDVREADPMLPEEEYATGLLKILPIAAAASIAIVLYAASAWTDINNPFLAMDSLINPMGWLQ